MLKTSPTFTHAIAVAQNSLGLLAKLVHTEKWQGVNIESKPEMATYEILNYSLVTPVWTDNLVLLAEDIKPNLPWADKHFEERVCGGPINPGVEWANWPFGKSAATFLENGKFNHNYMERYWPKYAGLIGVPTKTAEDYLAELNEGVTTKPPRGIYHKFGDLRDLVNQLAKEPDTRQAYLPVWFPEDTGVVHGSRVPCSLGYHFIMRDGFLHCNYYLRSCDFVRHFRDDIYLTVRLMLWILQECGKKNSIWKTVKPGLLTIHITSFHLFKADYQPLFGKEK